MLKNTKQLNCIFNSNGALNKFIVIYMHIYMCVYISLEIEQKQELQTQNKRRNWN